MKKRVAKVNFIESLGWWKLGKDILVKRALEKTAGKISTAAGVLALRDRVGKFLLIRVVPRLFRLLAYC